MDIKFVKNYNRNSVEDNDSNPSTKISKELVLKIKLGRRE